MKHKTKKASILAVSTIILSILLFIALSMALISARERKNSASSEKSSQAFYMANNGIEAVLKDITLGSHTNGKVNEIAPNIPGASCSGGTINTSEYKVQLYDANDAAIDCASTTTEIYRVARIKSTGLGATQTRAIEAAAAAGLTWVDVTFQNSWANNGASYNSVQYALDSKTGLVYLRGYAYRSAGASTACIFTLPNGYYSASKTNFVMGAHQLAAWAGWAPYVTINTSGCVAPNAATQYVILDGAVFSPF